MYKAELAVIQEEVKSSFNRMPFEGSGFSDCKYECGYPNCSVVRSGQRIVEHVQVDHRERRPQCPNRLCGKKFSRGCVYVRHLRICKYRPSCEKKHVSVTEGKGCEECRAKEWNMILSQFGLDDPAS